MWFVRATLTMLCVRICERVSVCYKRERMCVGTACAAPRARGPKGNVAQREMRCLQAPPSPSSHAHRAVALSLARTCAAHYLPAPAAEALSRQPSTLILEAVAGCTRVLNGAAHAPSPHPSKRATAQHDQDLLGPHKAPQQHAPPPPVSASVAVDEHGALLAASATHASLALLAQLLDGLELPPAPEAAGLLLARATLFALHWSFAALPMQVSVCLYVCAIVGVPLLDCACSSLIAIACVGAGAGVKACM